jgi:DNA-binding MarR family transcriptional regulator
MGTSGGPRYPDPAGPADGPHSAEDDFLLALIAISRRIRARGPEDALEPGAFLVLHTVACHGPARPSEVADRLQLDASTISRHLRNLERAGMIVRGSDPHDRRAARVQVSAAGRTVLEDGFQARRARVSAAFGTWPAEDRHALVSLLTRLADDLSRTGSDKEGT